VLQGTVSQLPVHSLVIQTAVLFVVSIGCNSGALLCLTLLMVKVLLLCLFWKWTASIFRTVDCELWNFSIILVFLSLVLLQPPSIVEKL
jgi:hypothetical protein